jgi:SPT2 chromatin protein
MSVRVQRFDHIGIIRTNMLGQFLSSVLSSIETGKPTPIPPPAPRSPAPASVGAVAKHEIRKPPHSADKSARSSVPSVGMKRKAEEQLRRPSNSDGQSPGKQPPKPAPTLHTVKPRPASGSRPTAKPPTANAPPAPAIILPAVSPSKPPVRGSFADLMLKAKAVQEKAPVHVGVLKHQPVSKERLSKAEKKKRALEALAKEKEAQMAKKSASASSASGGPKTGAKVGDGTPVKRREPEENTYKGTARPTQLVSRPAYKGTAGSTPRGKPDEKAGRAGTRRDKPQMRDEYLATDEEDEGDYADDYDDYYSDESSDMEGGFEDMEKEEEVALKVAKEEDEEDIRQELAAKREKAERKKKLAALASKLKR